MACLFLLLHLRTPGGHTLLRHLQVQKPWKTTAFMVQDLAILSSFICVWGLYVRTTDGAMPINAYSRLQLCKYLTTDAVLHEVGEESAGNAILHEAESAGKEQILQP